ncbi:MAG TPA: hypothetical protein VNT52_18805 [Acidimicrobiales bacterium]|nr:hypothetical protein [Acidimicrobiales bacterium]
MSSLGVQCPRCGWEGYRAPRGASDARAAVTRKPCPKCGQRVRLLVEAAFWGERR